MARIDDLKRQRSEEIRETAHHKIVRAEFARYENHDLWIMWKQLGMLYEGVFRLAKILERESAFTFTPAEITYFTKLKRVAGKIRAIRKASNAADADLQKLATEQEVLDFDYGPHFSGL